MTMAKSKQIDFSLQSNFENSDRQENVNNQTIFTENSQMKRVSFPKSLIILFPSFQEIFIISIFIRL